MPAEWRPGPAPPRPARDDREATRSPISVAHVVLTLDVGGLERVVIDLVRSASARTQDVSILCLERPGGLAAVAASAGAEVVALGKPPGLRPALVGRVARELRRLRPDVVHTHQVAALLYAGTAARHVGIGSVVHTEHGDHVARCRTRGGKFRAGLLRAIAATRADRFCCVSGDLLGRVAASRAVPRRKLVLVPNGIDTTPPALPRGEAVDAARRALGLPLGAPVVGTMGRLAEVKRQDVLLRGFALLLSARPDARLVLIGDGPERAALEALAADLGLGDRVVFAGYQPDPARLLPALDVFALTSRSEGMPLAILEAWAAGIPVVATRVGGIPALIDPGRTGFLVDPGDDAGLAARLIELIADPTLADRIGDAGRAVVVADHDLSVMADAYDREYRALLRPRPSAGG